MISMPTEPKMISDMRSFDLPRLQSEAVSQLEFALAGILGRARVLTQRQVASFLRDKNRLRGYRLPLQPLIRRRMREFYDDIYMVGGSTVGNSQSFKISSRRSPKIRQKADFIVDGLVARIETELKEGWVRHGFVTDDDGMLSAHTDKVFDDFGAR